MNLINMMKTLLQKKKKEKKSSSVFSRPIYGLFSYNEENGDHKLIFVHKHLKAPIALVSYDLEKLKEVSRFCESDKNCILIIRRIENITIDVGEMIECEI